MRLAFRWEGGRCTVSAPPPVAGIVGELFPSLAVGESPSDAADIVVEAAAGCWRVEAAGTTVCATPAEAASAVELGITRRLLASDRRHAHLHACGAVTRRGAAIIALGPSGSGKSTLAYAWARMGRPLLGDDVLAVDAEGRARPFPRPLKVDAHHVAKAGERPECTPGWDPDDREVWVVPNPSDGWAAGSHPVAVVAVLEGPPGAGLRLDPLPSGRLLRVLLDSLHPSGVQVPAGLDRLIALAGKAHAWRARFDDAAGLARALEERADADRS